MPISIAKSLLLKAEKPARYVGGEYNTAPVKKDAACNFLLCFPDIYEIAQSNLGIKILYHVLNLRADTNAELCYAPALDFAEILTENNTPLFSLQSQTAMREFDAVGFSLQYELSYTNVLFMLRLGNIPLLSSERGEADPIVIAGGPNTVNPLPLNRFVDVFCIGDGEDAICAMADIISAHNKNGKKGGRRALLERLNQIDCVYVPSVEPNKRVVRAVVDLEKAEFPTAIMVSNIEAVFNRAVLELFRGCPRGCRFCQAGFIYRPARYRSVETLTRYASELISNCGFDEMSLSSLSTCDYPMLAQLAQRLKPIAESANVSMSLPSTRADAFETQFALSPRLTSLTFAPEAATQRLRDVINKNITEEDIISCCKKAFERGYSAVKLYFMLGLPTETDEDAAAIISIVKLVRAVYRKHSLTKKPLHVSVSASTFVPKAHTPFQREAFCFGEKVRSRQRFLQTELKKIGVKFSYSNNNASAIECVLGRGGEEIGAVLLRAFELGCRFDGWTDRFSFELWSRAFDECGVDMNKYLGFIEGELEYAKIVDVGISGDFFERERKRAIEGVITPDCRNSCAACGLKCKQEG